MKVNVGGEADAPCCGRVVVRRLPAIVVSNIGAAVDCGILTARLVAERSLMVTTDLTVMSTCMLPVPAVLVAAIGSVQPLPSCPEV